MLLCACLYSVLNVKYLGFSEKKFNWSKMDFFFDYFRCLCGVNELPSFTKFALVSVKCSLV